MTSAVEASRSSSVDTAPQLGCEFPVQHTALRSVDRGEVQWLMSIFLIWLLANVITLDRYRMPWVDEIQFADPAIRWVSGLGFSSTVWIAQAADAFWAGNAPLYSMLLSVWLTIFGTEAIAVRSLNLVLLGTVVGIVWWLARTRSWVPERAARLVLVALLLCGHGVVFSSRGRYDALGMLLFALAALAWTNPVHSQVLPGHMSALPPSAPRLHWSRRASLVALMLIAATGPAAGLALLPAALIYLVFALWVQGRAVFERAGAVLLGLLLGAVGLKLFLDLHGVWDAFRESTSAVGLIDRGWAAKLAGLPKVYFNDKSLVLLILVAMCLPWRARSMQFALPLVAILPAALQLAGKFPIYYSWMVYGPLAIAVCGARLTSLIRPVVFSLGFGAVVVGLPLRLACVGWHWAEFDSAPIEAYAQTWLRREDRLIVDFKAYYAARRHSTELFAPTALQAMRPAERAATTALWIRPDDLPRVVASLGGQWIQVGPILSTGHLRPGSWAQRMPEFVEQDYSLAIYRRILN